MTLGHLLLVEKTAAPKLAVLQLNDYFVFQLIGLLDFFLCFDLLQALKVGLQAG